ncbi:MAG: DMT family transporter [Pseudomonadota bacterium]
MAGALNTIPKRGGALRPALALVVNAFVWGVSWWPFRTLHEQGLHPLWSTAGVYLVCLACVLAWRPATLRELRQYPQLWLLALASGLTNVGFNWGVTVGDVVRVVLLFYLMPAWSVLLAWGLLGERPGAAALARLVLALAGVAVVLGADTTGLPVPSSLADWLGLVGGFSFALTNIMLRRLHTAPAPARVVAMFGGGAVLAAAVAAAGTAQGLIAAPALPVAGLLVAAALTLGFLVANIALQYGASRLAAHTTALIMLSEVVFASVSSVLLGASEPSLRTWLGGALILAAAAWAAWPARAANGTPSAH